MKGGDKPLSETIAKRKTVVVGISLRAEIAQWIDHQAIASHRTRSGMIEYILAQWIEFGGLPTLTERNSQ